MLGAGGDEGGCGGEIGDSFHKFVLKIGDVRGYWTHHLQWKSMIFFFLGGGGGASHQKEAQLMMCDILKGFMLPGDLKLKLVFW